jgi:hypothetical protein
MVKPHPLASLAFKQPRRFAAAWLAPAPVTRALATLLRRLAALGRQHRGGGPPEPPEERAPADSTWDDPVFWMRMTH